VIEQDNSAGRLHNLLELVRSGNGNASTGEVWAETLGVAATDRPALFKRLAVVVSLPATVRADMNSLGINVSAFVERLANVEAAFATMNLDNQLGHFLSGFGEPEMVELKGCSSLLHQMRPQAGPSDDDVAGLLKEVDEVADHLLNSDIDGDVKAILWRHVVALREALETYRIGGVEPLLRAYQSVIGDVVLRQDTMERASKTEAGGHFIAFMKKLGAVHTPIGLIVSITTGVMKELTPPPAPVVVVEQELPPSPPAAPAEPPHQP